MKLRTILGTFVFAAVPLFACASAPEGAAVDDEFATVDEAAAKACTTAYAPVCATNGVTYTNKCRANGRKVAYVGACKTECKGLVCKSGQICNPGAKCTPQPPRGDNPGHACDPILPHCANASPCDLANCGAGTHCEEQVVQCIKAPCPPIAACVADVVDPCATVRCASGTHCESHQVMCKKAPCPPIAECVADKLTCKSDADCRTEADYCTGCDCRALATGQTLPVCSGPGVRCLVDPCRSKTAACVSGACVAR